jgi:putative oxidoreductase
MLGSSLLVRWAPLPLRLIVGYGFIVHGYAKLSRGPDSFAAVLHTIGVPLPFLFAWLTTLVELIGGAAILVGAFVPIAALPMAVVLVTALLTIHLPYGFFSVKLVEVSANGTKFGPVGYEVILLYLAGLAALVVGGAGPLSVDAWRHGFRPARHGAETRIRHGASAKALSTHRQVRPTLE